MFKKLHKLKIRKSKNYELKDICLHDNLENKFCYCRNRQRALRRRHSILLELCIKQYKLGRIRQVAILNSPVATSWRTESSNISLVVLDKLLF